MLKCTKNIHWSAKEIEILMEQARKSTEWIDITLKIYLESGEFIVRNQNSASTKWRQLNSKSKYLCRYLVIPSGLRRRMHLFAPCFCSIPSGLLLANIFLKEGAAGRSTIDTSSWLREGDWRRG